MTKVHFHTTPRILATLDMLRPPKVEAISAWIKDHRELAAAASNPMKKEIHENWAEALAIYLASGKSQEYWGTEQ